MTIAPIAALGTAWIVTLVILAILIIALVIVGVWGNKQQKKSADAQQQLQDAAQPMTLLVIDNLDISKKMLNAKIKNIL